jgi:hypothetical protein
LLVGEDQKRFRSGKFVWKRLGTIVKTGPFFAAGSLPKNKETPLKLTYHGLKGQLLLENTLSILVT